MKQDKTYNPLSVTSKGWGLAERRNNRLQEIVRTYGSVVDYDKRNDLGEYIGALGALTRSGVGTLLDAIQSNAPTLRHLDMAYGKGSADMFLFSVLKSMFTIIGVDGSKMQDPQIDDLAQNIAMAYADLNTDEIKVFITRFKQARYERFYGDTSYYQAVMKSIAMFREERNREFAMIPPKQQTDGISWEEYCKRHNISDRKNPLEDIQNNGLNTERATRVMDEDRKRKLAEDCRNETDESIRYAMEKIFYKDFGITVDEYLKDGKIQTI